MKPWIRLILAVGMALGVGLGGMSCGSTTGGGSAVRAPGVHYSSEELPEVRLAPTSGAVLQTGENVEVRFQLDIPETSFRCVMQPILPPTFESLRDRYGFRMNFPSSGALTNGQETLRFSFGLSYDAEQDPRKADMAKMPESIAVTGLLFKVQNRTSLVYRTVAEVPVDFTWICVKSNAPARRAALVEAE